MKRSRLGTGLFLAVAAVIAALGWHIITTTPAYVLTAAPEDVRVAPEDWSRGTPKCVLVHWKRFGAEASKTVELLIAAGYSPRGGPAVTDYGGRWVYTQAFVAEE